ncbi:MAG: thiolase domain-containing protein [Halobacteriaceae archaeon]
MENAYIIGVGETPYGSFPDRSYRDLFAEATQEALDSANINPGDIDEVILGTLGVGGRQIGLSVPAASTYSGIFDVPVTRVENACAASGHAVRQATQAVRSGMADIVLAGGFEIMTDMSDDVAKYWLGVSGEMEWERLTGTTFAGVYAQMASAYLNEYDVDDEVLSQVAVKNHGNAAKNPDAQLNFTCTIEDAESAPVVADPLTLYHCCPTTDGAAAVIVANESAITNPEDAVRIAGIGASSDHVGVFQRESYTRVPASEQAAQRAYERADITPDQLDIAEVHDCFTIAELLAYEDLGFCERGSADEMIINGVTDPDGELPVNMSGGLKAKGHPIGATGAGQLVELYKQLTHQAGSRQIDSPTYGLAHNVGGSGGAAVVHILEGNQ